MRIPQAATSCEGEGEDEGCSNENNGRLISSSIGSGPGGVIIVSYFLRKISLKSNYSL